MAQDFENRSLKTQTQLRVGDVGMAGPITNHEKNPSGYEESASLRRLLRLLSLDFVSAKAVECRGGLMGHGRIFLSEDLARFPIAFRQSVGWEDSFQVCYLRCPTKRGIPKPSRGED